MSLSNTSKIKYKFNTNGRNTVQMAKLLKEYRVSGFLISVNYRTITMRVPQDAIKSNRKAMEGLRNEN